ncbi:MAG: VWA domain-containing protein [Candidatus Acidiferrales bacterium]
MWVLFSAWCLLLAMSLQAQQVSKPDLNPARVMRVETRLVVVDVVVTDGKGRPIEGLTREDFALKEAGKPQEIAVFDWTQRAAALQPPAPLPAGVHTNEPAYHPPKEPVTLLLLDSLNTPLSNQSLMRIELIRYLTSPGSAGRWMAVLALGSNLRVLQDFTTDRELLLAAADRQNSQQSPQFATRQLMTSKLKREELERMREVFEACGCAEVVDNIEHLEDEVLAQSDRDRMQLTLAALRAIALSLVGYPGRKNLVWLSASFPTMYFGREKWSMDAELRETARLLNDAQVAVYPVDPRGLVGGIEPESEQDFIRRVAGQRSASGYDPNRVNPSVPNVKDEKYYLYQSQSAMKALADNSGGQAFYNRNDIGEAVALALKDGSSYYTLGYYPTNGNWDGSFRQIEVKLARSGLRVRYRRGYYATLRPAPPPPLGTPSEGSQDELRSAMYAPLPPTGVIFRAYVPPPEGGTTTRVEVEFRLRKDGLRLADLSDGGRDVNADFLVAAFSADGKPVNSAAKRIDRQLTSENYERIGEEGFVLRMALELPAGEFQLRLLVRDNHTGLLGRVDIPLSLAPAAPPTP